MVIHPTTALIILRNRTQRGRKNPALKLDVFWIINYIYKISSWNFVGFPTCDAFILLKERVSWNEFFQVTSWCNKHQGRARVEEEISRTAEVRMGPTFGLRNGGRFSKILILDDTCRMNIWKCCFDVRSFFRWSMTMNLWSFFGNGLESSLWDVWSVSLFLVF